MHSFDTGTFKMPGVISGKLKFRPLHNLKFRHDYYTQQPSGTFFGLMNLNFLLVSNVPFNLYIIVIEVSL